MVAWGKTVAAAINTMLLLAGVAYPFTVPSGQSNNAADVPKSGEEREAVAGRMVSVPVQVYKKAFKATLSLGECPLVMEAGSIKTCKDKFEGEVVHLPKGGMTVDVSRIQSSEDVITHGMGGIGMSIGVLGIVGVNSKINVAVTAETGRNALNLMSSYEISRGVLALHHPRVKHIEGDSALYLSEIELGGNELLLVTLEFESEKQKVEVEVSVTFKILFITISAKLNYVNEKFKSKASCRIQFKSSWREEINSYYSSLSACIPRVKEIEDMYMNGPQELRSMSTDDDRLHSFYYFSSWKTSPYGSQFNLALINHDLEFLTERNTEIKAVIHRINKLKDQTWPSDVRRQMIQLNETLTDKAQKLTSGLDEYHQLSPDERQLLRDIYGHNKAPQYYQRYLNKIIAS